MITALKKDKPFEKQLLKSFEFEWIEHKGEPKIQVEATQEIEESELLIEIIKCLKTSKNFDKKIENLIIAEIGDPKF